MIRQFTLINSKNETWTFTDKDFKCFLSNPQGLGFSRTISTNRYGSVLQLEDVTDAFPNPTGEIIFYDDSNVTRYEKYNEFCRFIASEPLVLTYTLPNGTEYTLDCIVSSLGKTEGTTEKTLSCPIQFYGLSFYKGATVTTRSQSPTFTVANDSDVPVGLKLVIDGSLLNPYIKFSQDGNLYGEAKFLDEYNQFSQISLNSVDGEEELILKQNNVAVANPLSYQDLSISNGSIYVTFVRLARGNTQIEVGVDSGTIGNITATITPIYRSV